MNKFKKKILSGTPEWEKVCEQCGMCCLVKIFCPEDKNFYMTRVRCSHLDSVTRKCDCYSAEVRKRKTESGFACCENGGSVLNMHTLCNDYVVPGFCPYVKKFVKNNKLKRPYIDWKNTISEKDVDGCDLRDYIIPGTESLFKYNPAVNKFWVDNLCEKQK